MEALPREIVRVLHRFEDVFSERVWDWVQVLVVGAILTPGQRTVAAVLRVMGLGDERQFQNYHRVLSRARWSSREASRRLLGLHVDPIDGRRKRLLGAELDVYDDRRRQSARPGLA